jgi:pyridoxamine 5'-phosphate oxidase
MFSEAAPRFYSDLDAALKEAWRQLERGVTNRNAPFHTPVVATLDADGAPDARVMVLRQVDPIRRTLRFHSDARSPKAVNLAASKPASVLAYDPRRKLQLRLQGQASFASKGPLANAAWAASSLSSRRCYLSSEAPGVAVATPTSGLPDGMEERSPTLEESQAGRANFGVLVVDVEAIDWLYLAHQGHRRARFSWDSGQLAATWLMP